MPHEESLTVAEAPQGEELEFIKKTAIVTMFADDELMDFLVLKGGNTTDLVHQVNAAASIDPDFSTGDDLDFEQTLPKVLKTLEKTFETEGYKAFDIKMTARPGKMPDDFAAFWGGELIEFKLIGTARADELEHDLDRMHREAIRLGQGPKSTMDISRYEYTADKQEHQLLGYTIYVYSSQMIVCEKLRAICQ